MLRKLPYLTLPYLTLLAILLAGCGDDNNSNEIVWPPPQHDLQPPKYDLTGTWKYAEFECDASANIDTQETRDAMAMMVSVLELETEGLTIGFVQKGNDLEKLELASKTVFATGTISEDKYTFSYTTSDSGNRGVVIDEGTAIDENNISGTNRTRVEGGGETITIICNYKMVRVED